MSDHALNEQQFGRSVNRVQVPVTKERTFRVGKLSVTRSVPNAAAKELHNRGTKWSVKKSSGK